MTELIPDYLQKKVANVFFYEKDYDYHCIAQLATITLKKPYVEVRTDYKNRTYYNTRMTIVPEYEWESRADKAVKISRIAYWWYVYKLPVIKNGISNIKHKIFMYRRNRRLRNITLDDMEQFIRTECNKHNTCADCKERYFCQNRAEKWIKYSGKYEEVEDEYYDEDDDY